MRKFRLGIVGHGFVGKAVDYAFTNPNLEKFYVDPKHDTTIDDLINWAPDHVFVCAPTPMSEDGNVDASIVEDAVLKLLNHTKSSITIKSTVPPNIVRRLWASFPKPKEDNYRVVLNPEFLTEKSAAEQFVHPGLVVLGGAPEACAALVKMFELFSLCSPTASIKVMSPTDAAFVKYAINSFLAMKVTFFNQLYDAVDQYGGSFPTIIGAVGTDERIGHSHTKVPGFDGKKGFGGACFPKDTLAFTKFSEQLTLLEEAVKINNEYRSQYELDDREKEQNVNYGQTKEEQQDQDNGSVE